MNRQDLENIRDILYQYDKDYICSNNRTEKERIRERAYNYAKNLPSELYLELNDGVASGLFKYGHFDVDMNNCIKTLTQMITNGKNE